jgi:hypothetical protein
MSKRISLFFITFILCGTIGFAQNISDTQYEQLYNYCLCKYAETYLNEYYGKIHPDYGKNIGYDEIKKNLSFTIQQPLTPDSLLGVMSKNNKNATVRLVKDYIKNTEHKYKEGLNSDELTDRLLLKNYGTHTDKVDFTNLNNSLKKDISIYLKEITSEKTDTVKITPIVANSSVSTNRGRDRRQNALPKIEDTKKDSVSNGGVDNKNKDLSFGVMMPVIISILGLFFCVIIRWKFWTKIRRSKKKKAIFYGITAFFVLILLSALYPIVRKIIIVTIGILAGSIIIFYIIKKHKDENRKISKSGDNEKIKDKFTALNKKYEQLKDNYEKTVSERNEWKKKSIDLEREIDKLFNENIELGKENEAYKFNSKPDTNSITEQKGIAINFDKEKIEDTFTPVLYADAIIDGYFNRLSETPNADTIFELHLQNTKTATFSVFSGAEQLIIKRPEFLEGCEKQVLNNVKIESESEGTASLNSNYKWEIIKPLNIVIN